MPEPSWRALQDPDPAWQLAPGLAAQDPMGARDVGWVEQMRPLVREFSAPGDLVCDPFCGFGTTLLAAELEGRRGIGFEIDAQRAALAQARLAAHGAQQQTVLAQACAADARLAGVRLVLSNVPYFGCRWPGPATPQHYYALDTYAAWLEQMRLLLADCKRVLPKGAHLVLAAQNLHIGAHFVPLAADLARLLAERFYLLDERLIVYPPVPGRRSHESVLIARHQARPIDLPASRALLDAFCAAHPDCIVFGSFAAYLRGAALTPGDLDLLVPRTPGRIAAMAHWLEQRGFRISRWGAPAGAGAAASAIDSHYLRAERLDRSAGLVVLDLCFDDGVHDFETEFARAEMLGQLRLLALQSHPCSPNST